jgi:hypothetical protein
MAGVAEVLEEHGRAIVLEDDLVLSPHFLQYMNDGLDRYEDDARVASIHGYVYPVDGPLPETFFLKGADCWGWATWSRAWSHFEPDGARLLARTQVPRVDARIRLRRTVPLHVDAAGPDRRPQQFVGHPLVRVLFPEGSADALPGRSLVTNIGNDSSGTHCGATDAFGGQGVQGGRSIGRDRSRRLRASVSGVLFDTSEAFVKV